MTGYTSFLDLPSYLLSGTHTFLEDGSILAITDLHGDIVFANDGFCRISGYSREELIGKNHRILKSGAHPDEFYRDLWKTIARGEVWRGDICNRAKDGSRYWVDSTISAMRDSHGRITHYCALRIDITARKKAESDLREVIAREFEQQRLASVGRILDAVLHDLNNCMSAGLLVSELAEIKDPQHREVLVGMMTRMANLTRNVRDLSSGRPTEKRSFNLGNLVRDACKLAAFEPIKRGDLSLVVDVDPLDPYTTRANEAQILEIVMNLVKNAAEAMRGRPDSELRVTGSINHAKHCAIIDVSDNGPGVPETVLRDLFGDFVSSKGPGRGVGLAASRKIAREHAGDLVHVRTPQGARFRLMLPYEVKMTKAVPPSARGDVVLVMEDEPAVAETITELLRQNGVRALLARSSDELITWANQFKATVAAAVLDSTGSAEDYALVGFLRAVKHDMPIVLTSAVLKHSGMARTRHGLIHCLPKPFKGEDFINLILR